MSIVEETIEATLDSHGQLILAQMPQLPPGPVHVTIRVANVVSPRRGLADVMREIAADQRARGFEGRSEEELRADEDACIAEDEARDLLLDSARGRATAGE